MGEQKITVGRIVHYVDPTISDQCLAAMVTSVDEEGRPSLTIYNPRSAATFAVQDVEHGEPDADSNLKAHTWHWPERA